MTHNTVLGFGGAKHQGAHCHLVTHQLSFRSAPSNTLLPPTNPPPSTTVISRREFLAARAAFLATHRVADAGAAGAAFSFADYCLASFDDDVASILGLGLPMWLLLIAFMLLSDRLGWCVWIFTLLAGAVLAVLSTKLVSIVRFATRAGGPHALTPSAFWLRRPWLMLPPTKLLLFFTSLVWSNAVFFAINFGKNSCFFSRTGFQGAPISWWAIVVVSVVYFLILALNTMPLYALCVQLGADHKPHILAPDLAAHFARVASTRADASVAARRGGGGAPRVSMRVQRLVSLAVPRQADAGRRRGRGAVSHTTTM